MKIIIYHQNNLMAKRNEGIKKLLSVLPLKLFDGNKKRRLLYSHYRQRILTVLTVKQLLPSKRVNLLSKYLQ